MRTGAGSTVPDVSLALVAAAHMPTLPEHPCWATDPLTQALHDLAAVAADPARLVWDRRTWF